MILVVGGQASGKRSYVRTLGYSDGDMADGVFDASPVMLNLHDALRGDSRTPDELASVLGDKMVITCCEIGNGIVPLDKDERAWRERVGRTCNLLDERADSVVRMVCGIPVVLKQRERKEV